MSVAPFHINSESNSAQNKHSKIYPLYSNSDDSDYRKLSISGPQINIDREAEPKEMTDSSSNSASPVSARHSEKTILPPISTLFKANGLASYTQMHQKLTSDGHSLTEEGCPTPKLVNRSPSINSFNFNNTHESTDHPHQETSSYNQRRSSGEQQIFCQDFSGQRHAHSQNYYTSSPLSRSNVPHSSSSLEPPYSYRSSPHDNIQETYHNSSTVNSMPYSAPPAESASYYSRRESFNQESSQHRPSLSSFSSTSYAFTRDSSIYNPVSHEQNSSNNNSSSSSSKFLSSHSTSTFPVTTSPKVGRPYGSMYEQNSRMSPYQRDALRDALQRTRSRSPSQDDDLIDDITLKSKVIMIDGVLGTVEEQGSRVSSRYDPTTGRNLYFCPATGCDKGFTRRYNLISHMRVHSGERPFVCPYCAAAFSRKHDLKRHKRSLHLNDKPHVCQHCSLTFSRSDALKRHIEAERKRNSNSHQGDHPGIDF